MNNDELLIELLQKLDGNAHKYHELNLYSRGMQPLAFLSPESKAALSNRFGRIASNIPRLAVTSLAERLRVSGFTGADVWPDWIANDLDQLSGVAHREAFVLGQAFVIVWGSETGPRATVESAEQVAVKRSPITRQIVAAVKRVRTKTTTEAWLYLPEAILHYQANSPGASTAGFKLIESIANPLGVVPVVALTNTDRLLDLDGISEIEDLKPVVDGLCKTLADLAVAEEYTARPRRWATGIELVEKPVLDADGNPMLDEHDQPLMAAVNPIPEGNRAMISENDAAKFGQLDGANLAGYEAAVRIWLGQIMAVSALPSHFLGILTDQPSSADALRASEASLTARAEARQLTFGRSWEQVARLIVAVRDGVMPEAVPVRVVWADASTRSVAQESDAAVKLFAAGVLSRETTLARLGFTADEIEAEMGRVRDDALVGADIRLGRYLSASTDV
ncbi:MAG: phage portal protein [Mycolicibacterium sp.]|uniref:phage portal protein n=1 Tax=Mycolicibacterium sp. TaxID=2320850 RepID=UPI003D0FBEF5